MNFCVLTIFPEMFDALAGYGIIRRAVESGRISIAPVNIRDYADGRHKVTDDRPYGGGSGMVMKPEPLAAAIRAARERLPEARTVLLSPRGRAFDQEAARQYAGCKGLIFVCGRYEGLDERICETYIDDEISIGDYILTGGELAAMVVIDAVTRNIPGVLGAEDAAECDSFSDGRLEYAHYTRPREFEESEVPEVLLSGNHRAIEDWRLESALLQTLLKRPDLLEKSELTDREKQIVKKWCRYLESLVSY
ncbi:MAG: tRNA (guanosine(37)-N1)-methyltransferase TrmD [Desulfobacteraceae bacterium]|nr:tRNA (guanosine(37)-N1)-methyltransferase TrmD [Desulfobacteraceae bacterium]MCF8095798.1 tRNA (guanosine(37)-N1)-methyltransferase TrmD [Desulfobacteraceae bacterium]